MVRGDIGEWDFLTDDETDLLGNGIGRDSSRKSQDKNTNQFGKVLTDFCEMFHCIPLNNNNNNVHLSCAHQCPERSHDTY